MFKAGIYTCIYRRWKQRTSSTGRNVQKIVSCAGQNRIVTFPRYFKACVSLHLSACVLTWLYMSIVVWNVHITPLLDTTDDMKIALFASKVVGIEMCLVSFEICFFLLSLDRVLKYSRSQTSIRWNKKRYRLYAKEKRWVKVNCHLQGIRKSPAWNRIWL